jgi:hypothetical protein
VPAFPLFIKWSLWADAGDMLLACHQPALRAGHSLPLLFILSPCVSVSFLAAVTVPDRSHLQKERFIAAPAFRGFSPWSPGQNIMAVGANGSEDRSSLLMADRKRGGGQG